MNHITRTKYLNELMSLNNTKDIKVITGIRRCGKSVLLEDFASLINSTEQNSNIIKINLQHLENQNLLDYRALHDYALAQHQENKHNLLIIDEVQLCNNFETTINSLHSKGIFDIYLSGSNAFLLSSDLATLFTGRVMELEVFPFSFKEFTTYFKNNTSIDNSFDKYVDLGGMAGSYDYKDERHKRYYLNEVYNTILIRDLVSKYKIRNVGMFKNIAKFLMDNVGNLVSPNSICNYLNSNGSEISRKTVSKYIDYLCNAFLFYEAPRYDLKGKKFLVNNSKLYLSDISFRRAINGSQNLDLGRIYENLVYLELLRRGYEVYVGQLYNKEVDFVAMKNDSVVYIQVCGYIEQEETFNRECAPLLSIRDAFPKMVIARTHRDTYKYEGIDICDIARWLLN